MLTNKGVEILCIGTELLLGNILNSNAKWLAEELALLGLPHYLQTVVGDNHDRLKKVILDASKRSRILITTGGLGPTPDDLTIETIAATFDTELITNEIIVKDINQKFNSNLPLSKNNFKQAKLPKGANIVRNPSGTAPGIIWDPIEEFTIITLPGVPSEMKLMWDKTIKSYLINKFNSKKNIITSKILNFTGISESKLSSIIPNILSNTNPTVAPYASLGEVKLRITAHSNTIEEANRLIKPIESKLKELFGKNIFSTNNQTLAYVVIDLLRKRGETLSVAESCTGGSLSSAITSIPGSSDVFLGGVVAYNNKIKQDILRVPLELIEQYGAVSKPVVQSMAGSIRETFDSDWSIAISGIAGPKGGSATKPVGRVELYIKGKQSYESIQEDFGSYRSREDIQKLSVVRALDRLRLFLLK